MSIWNNTASMRRQGLADLWRRYGVKNYRKPRKCPECGTRNTLCAPKGDCLECLILQEKGKRWPP